VTADVDIEAAAPPPSRSTVRFRRWLAVLVGLAAISAASISWVEANSGRQEEQAFVDASRGALEIFVKIAASQPRTQFEGDAVREVLSVGIEGLGRVTRGPGTNRDEAFELALTESQAVRAAEKRLQRVALVMAAPPDEQSAVDPATLEAVNADPAELNPLVEEQNDAVDDANRYGTRQERAMTSLGLVAIAASLLGLAGLIGSGRTGRIVLTTAGATLAFAVIAVGTAFI
jgi:hypothetical protein